MSTIRIDMANAETIRDTLEALKGVDTSTVTNVEVENNHTVFAAHLLCEWGIVADFYGGNVEFVEVSDTRDYASPPIEELRLAKELAVLSGHSVTWVSSNSKTYHATSHTAAIKGADLFAGDPE